MKNNDYPSWLVPLDIALQLKAIGFDEPCVFKFERCEYTTFKMNIDSVFEDTSEYYFDDLETYKEGYNTRGYDILRPTWEQVFAWFRDKGYESYIRLESHSHFDEGNYYYFEIVKPSLYQIKQIYEQGDFDDYNEAREALVKALIQTYKNEQL